MCQARHSVRDSKRRLGGNPRCGPHAWAERRAMAWKEHLHACQMAYTFAKRLKILKGLTPYEYICQCWQKRTGALARQSMPSHCVTKHLEGFPLIVWCQ
jgi:hypothetical protein